MRFGSKKECCLTLGPQLGLVTHMLITLTITYFMIFILYDFMPMPRLPPSPSPSRYLATSSPRLQSRRWEGVSYLVQFAFLCPLSLALGTFPEERDFSLKITSVYCCWTHRHWNCQLSSLADNPDFGLFGLPWWCSGFPSLLLFLLSISEMILRYADRRAIANFLI